MTLIMGTIAAHAEPSGEIKVSEDGKTITLTNYKTDECFYLYSDTTII